MVDRIDGSGQASPRNLKEQYKHAADGFQAALDLYSNTDIPGQKAFLMKDMREYAQAMDHIAADLRKQKLLEQTSKLSSDLDALDQGSSNATKLQADLEKAKKSL